MDKPSVERQIIQSTPEPRTIASLTDDLRSLGVEPGMTLLVHSSLSSLGWVCGGPVAVIHALQGSLTEEGTLVMPTFTGWTDPALWENPPVPPDWIPVIRNAMPAYDPETTPTRSMGQIAECFRTWPGVRRSSHPSDSFAAWGRNAGAILADQALEEGLGESSPLARLYQLDAWVLLLGVDHMSNTSFHLAEHRAPRIQRFVEQGAPMLVDGRRQWVSYRTPDYSVDGFAEVGLAFEAAGHAHTGLVGSAVARLFSQPEAVDFACTWFRRHTPTA
jgi:aminoglycoside 3-N-acetyltransferase